jgi:hypothetical protein
VALADEHVIAGREREGWGYVGRWASPTDLDEIGARLEAEA